MDSQFVKTPNAFIVWYLVASKVQKPSESFDKYFRELAKLRRNCNFQDSRAK